MKRHSLSALFAAYDLKGDDLQALAESIKEQGQLQPITLVDGLIADGWNRYQACLVAGVEPRTEELPEGVDPWEYVKGANMLRRHMTPAERGAVLLRKREMESIQMDTPTIAEIRKDIDVGYGTAQRVQKVIKAADPQINKALSENKISLDKAAKVAELPKAERKAAIEAAPEPHRKPEKLIEDTLAVEALDEANERAADLAVELEAYMLAAGENGEAAKEIIRLNQKVDAITRSRDEYMTKCSELIKQVKIEQAKVKKLEAKVKALESTSGGF